MEADFYLVGNTGVQCFIMSVFQEYRRKRVPGQIVCIN